MLKKKKKSNSQKKKPAKKRRKKIDIALEEIEELSEEAGSFFDSLEEKYCEKDKEDGR